MVKYDNPFDKKLEVWKNRIPESLKTDMVFVHDTLDMAKAIAESIFGDSPPPHVVFDIYRFIVAERNGFDIEEEAPED